METKTLTRVEGLEPVAVRVTLSCGWCAQQVSDVAGAMVRATGRLTLVGSPTPLRVSSGRPICPRCGGPLFVDDYKTVRQVRSPEGVEPEDEADGGEVLSAA